MAGQSTLPTLATQGSELRALRSILDHIEAAEARLSHLRRDTEQSARWALDDARSAVWFRLATLEKQIVTSDRGDAHHTNEGN